MKVVGSHVGEGTHFLAEVLGSSDGLGPVSTKVAIPVGHSSRDVLPVGNERRRKLPLAIWSDGGVQRKRDVLNASTLQTSHIHSCSPLRLNVHERTLIPTIITIITKNKVVLIVRRVGNTRLLRVHTVVEQILNGNRSDSLSTNLNRLLFSVPLRRNHKLYIDLIFLTIQCT